MAVTSERPRTDDRVAPSAGLAETAGNAPSPADHAAPRAIAWTISLALTALAVWLRHTGLNPSSLFIDDAWVAVTHRLTWSELPRVDFTTPGFSAITKGWLDLVGYSNLKIQLPVFAAAIVLPAATFVLLQRRIKWYWAAVAATLLAISPIHIVYSVRVKQYSMEALFALALIAGASAVIDAPHQRRRWTALTLVSAFALVTSFSTIFVVVPACAGAVVGLGLSRRDAGSIRSMFAADEGAALVRMTVLGIFAVVWFFSMIAPSLSNELNDFWADNYLPTGQGFRAFLSAWYELSVQTFEGFVTLPGGATAGLLAVAGLLLLSRRPALLIVLAGPYVALVVASSLQMAPLGGLRTDIFIYPALASLLAFGLHECEALVRTHWSLASPAIRFAPLALTVTITGVLAMQATPEQSAYPVEDLAPLLADLEERQEDGDAVLLYYGASYHYAVYTDVPFDVVDRGLPFEVAFEQRNLVQMGNHRFEQERYRGYIDEAAQRGDRVWFVVAHPWDGDIGTITNMITDAGLRSTWDRQLAGASLTLLEPSAR